MLCCSTDFTGTNRMRGRPAASQIAAASLASFLPLRPSWRYGAASCAETMRARSPRAMSRRAQWCAPELASMATMQPCGRRAHQARNCSRRSARQVKTRPAASTACTWITRLARSTPTRTASPRVICSTDFPFPRFRLMTHTTNLGASTPLQDRGKSLRIPIERTCHGRLRLPRHAAHVELQGLPHLSSDSEP